MPPGVQDVVTKEPHPTPFPNSYDDVLKKMLDYLAFLCQAGPPPRFGDDDGGRVFDGRRNRAEHLLDPLAIGAALYWVTAFKQPGVSATEEMLWLLGEEGIQLFSGYPEWKSNRSAQFPHTGLYMAHAGEGSRSQMILDAGPLGGGSGGHGHADALSLTLNLERKALLVDPGACSYAGSCADRDNFRTTRAHNTVMVDGLSQAEPRTPFSWFQWPEVEVETVLFTPEFDFIVASHNGYARLESPVTHRHTLFTPREGFWFVLDELICDGPHDYAVHWHLAPGADVKRQTGDRWVVALERSKLHILTAADGCSPVVESGWFSPAYGGKQPAPIINLRKKAQGKETVATVLSMQNSDAPIPALTMLNHSPTCPAYRLTKDGKNSILILRDGFSTIRIDGWESDARFLYATLDADGHPVRVIFSQGTFCIYRDKILHESSIYLSHFIWERMKHS